MFYFHTHTRAPRDHRPVDGNQYSRHGRSFTASDGGNNRTQHHDTSAHQEEDPWCVRRMWVPPAQEHQGEEFAVALLTVCQQTNLSDEVNSGNRHVAALKIGVPSPSVAREYELSVNIGNVGKLYERHRLPVSRVRQRISPYLITLCSAFVVASGKRKAVVELHFNKTLPEMASRGCWRGRRKITGCFWPIFSSCWNFFIGSKIKWVIEF